MITFADGLGFMLIDGKNNLRPDIMLDGILSLAIIGKATDSLLRLAERRWMIWADTYRGA